MRHASDECAQPDHPEYPSSPVDATYRAWAASLIFTGDELRASRRLFSQPGKRDGMELDERVQVSVSRSIAASAIEIFRMLATPAIHPVLDGSGMLRAVWDQPVLGRVGDTFKMPMYLPEIGDYLMLNRVIVFAPDRHIVWEPTPGDAVAERTAGLPIGASQGYSWGLELRPDGDATVVTEIFDCTEASQGIRDDVANGQSWIPAMEQTLERLAARFEPT
jgi:hypothetical protein